MYSFCICPRLKNVVADFLSRPTQQATGSVAAMTAVDPVYFEEQHCCPETQRLLGGTSLKLAFRQTGTQCLARDVSTGTFCPIVPSNSEGLFFDHFHNVAHPGRLASRRIISSRFMSRGLSSDINAWACGCLACQRGKIHCHTRLAPQPIPILQPRFFHLHVDLVGPLQYSNNFNYILNIIDCTSKWMETVPLSETSAAVCAKALTFTWISHFGVPETIALDRGPQFTSSLWLQLCEMLNISHKQTTAYHPESNSSVERLHCRLKDALRARAAAATWSKELPFVLLRLRAQPREDTGLSVAEAVFGASIVLPNVFLQSEELSEDSIIKIVSNTLHVPATSLPRHYSSTQLPSELPADLLSAPLRWVCRGGVIPPLQPLYDGPYAVLHHDPCSFTIRVRSRDEVIAVSCLKACTEADAMPGNLRCPSRPLGSSPGGPATTKSLVYRPAGFFAAFFLGAATKWSRNRVPAR
jgi:hypothetical protein